MEISVTIEDTLLACAVALNVTVDDIRGITLEVQTEANVAGNVFIVSFKDTDRFLSIQPLDTPHATWVQYFLCEKKLWGWRNGTRH